MSRRFVILSLAALSLTGCNRASFDSHQSGLNQSGLNQSGLNEATANQPIVLRYSSPYSITQPFSRADRDWIKYVEEKSNGRLKFEPYWGKSLTGEAQSVLEIQGGVADVGFILPIYSKAGMNLIRNQTMFYQGAATPEQQEKVFQSLWAEFPQMRAELPNLKLMLVQGGLPPDIMTRSRPVRRLEDLRGLKIRAPMEITTVLSKLGVDAVMMPMGEVYTALSKGTIDGVIAPTDTLKSMHFAEVARYHTKLGISRGGYPARAFNMQAWNRLPADLQKLLEESSVYWTERLNYQINSAASEGVRFAKEYNVEFIELPAEDVTAFEKVFDVIAAETAQKLEAQQLPGAAMYARAQELVRAKQ
jgi:TRAP-type C4-dicarboxylate transport system substrate-binding protein